MEQAVRRWASWTVLATSVAVVSSGWIVVGAFSTWSGSARRQTGIDDAIDFTIGFGTLLLVWILAAVAFIGFVGRARRAASPTGRGTAPGRGLVTSWAVVVVLAVYVGLFFLVFMDFATPNRGMVGETATYAGIHVLVDAVAGGLAVAACLRARGGLRAAAPG